MRYKRRGGKIGHVQLASGLFRHTYTPEDEHSILHCTFGRREEVSHVTSKVDVMHRNVAIFWRRSRSIQARFY
jgi:hypothetical protein